MGHPSSFVTPSVGAPIACPCYWAMYEEVGGPPYWMSSFMYLRRPLLQNISPSPWDACARSPALHFLGLSFFILLSLSFLLQGAICISFVAIPL